MEKSYQTEIFDEITETKVVYGKEDSLKGVILEIAKIKDSKERNNAVDLILEALEQNKENNGFLGPKDKIVISNILKFQSIKLDDKDIYYIFFDYIHKAYEDNMAKIAEDPTYHQGVPLNTLDVVNSISNTLNAYYCGLNKNEKLREKLTITNEPDAEPRSIKEQKGMGCAACVEVSSVAHNLFLCSGLESAFVISYDSAIIHEDKLEISPHAYDVVKIGNSNRIIDYARNKIINLDKNIVDIIDEKIPIVKENFIYINAKQYENDKQK